MTFQASVTLNNGQVMKKSFLGWSVQKTRNELTKKSNLWRSIRKTGNEEVIFGLASTKKGQSLPLLDEETHEGGGLLIELPGS